MDMKIDASRIKAEREKRAWSQEHLAEAAGLALRTIQRVENSGSGSFETAKALAAVLELDVADLRARGGGTVPRSHSKVRYVAAAAAVVLGLFAFLTRSAIAGQVALDIGLSMNDEQPSKHHVVVDDGTHAEIRLEGQVRVLVTPTVSADGVMLSIQSVRVRRPEVRTGRNTETSGSRQRSGEGAIHVRERKYVPNRDQAARGLRPPSAVPRAFAVAPAQDPARDE